MKLNWPEVWQAGKACGKKYAPALLVIALGVLLLMLPGEPMRETAAEEQGGDSFDLEQLEEKLADALSMVEGAGEVEVVLTLDSGARQILAQNVQRETERTVQDTVTLGRGSGEQNVVPLQTLAPQFRGALVVCSGGGDPAVRLELLNAVTALTGLGADRVCICRGK